MRANVLKRVRLFIVGAAEPSTAIAEATEAAVSDQVVIDQTVLLPADALAVASAIRRGWADGCNHQLMLVLDVLQAERLHAGVALAWDRLTTAGAGTPIAIGAVAFDDANPASAYTLSSSPRILLVARADHDNLSKKITTAFADIL